MLIIRIPARTFESVLPLIKEQEDKGHGYMRDEDDGVSGRQGICQTCCKRVYFDDGTWKVNYEDRTKYLNEL